MSILEHIMAHKATEIATRMNDQSLVEISRLASATPPPHSFSKALMQASANNRFPVIAEIKRRSPSRGILAADFNPSTIARAYQKSQAACLSVLTDSQYFGGNLEHLRQVVGILPVLRKDFIVNEWQIAEARANGADAILLIVAVLTPEQLSHLSSVARQWGMDVIIEVHTATEVDMAMAADSLAMIGINNRDLKTFKTHLQNTLDLLPLIRRIDSNRLVISESGIATAKDIKILTQAGVDAYLIGETLMRAPETALTNLFAEVKPTH